MKIVHCSRDPRDRNVFFEIAKFFLRLKSLFFKGFKVLQLACNFGLTYR